MSIESPPQPTSLETSTLLSDLSLPLKNGGQAPVFELIQRWKSSVFAAHMETEQPLRYPNHDYNRHTKLADLGNDVSPTGHHDATLEQLVNIIEREQDEQTLLGVLEDEEYAVVMLATAIHDCGECTLPALEAIIGEGCLVGDIPCGKKTDSDRKNEAAVRRVVYQALFHDVDEAAILKIEGLISHQVKDHLHDLFMAAHEAGTLQTSLNAEDSLWACDHRHGDENETADEKRRINALERMTTEVRTQAITDANRYRTYFRIAEKLDVIDPQPPRHRVTGINRQYHAHQ